MTFGYNRNIYTQSMFDTRDDRDLPVPYTRYMTATLMYPSKVSSILEIGLGGGRTSWYLHRFLPSAHVTAVELDPTVAVRILTRSASESGNVAGRVYGVSTIGNVFGTLLTTVVLIPAIGSREITYLYAAVLALCSLSLFLVARLDAR